MKDSGFDKQLSTRAASAERSAAQPTTQQPVQGMLQLAANESRQAYQLRQLQDIADQRTPASPSVAASGHIVQRVVSLEMLEKKLDEDIRYHGTIDTNTPWHEAILVGDAWIGAGGTELAYGPPFDYQETSSDTKRHFRPPMIKKQSKLSGQAQANFEARAGNSGPYTFNAHATVPDIQDYPDNWKNKPLDEL